MNPALRSLAREARLRGRPLTLGRNDHSTAARAVRVTPDPFEALALEGLRDLPPTTKLVWCALAAANSNVETTNEQLSARLALSSRSVRLAFEMLEARGLVAVLDRGGPRRKRVVRAVAPQGGVR